MFINARVSSTRKRRTIHSGDRHWKSRDNGVTRGRANKFGKLGRNCAREHVNHPRGH